MVKKSFLAVLALSTALVFAVTPGHAGTDKKSDAKADGKECPMMSPETMKLMAPGDAHKTLEAFAGKWNYTVQHRMAPDAPAMEMKGKTVNRMIMGNRFLQQEAKGQAMKGQKMPAFEGMGLTGYDNVRKEYTTTWVDNMNTGMMTSTAQFDAAKNALTEKGTFSCPMTGKRNMNFRSVWTLVDKNKYTYEMFTKDEKGKEFKAMEIAYTRTK